MRDTGKLVLVGRLGQGRRNEEVALGSGAGGISKGLEAWAPSRNVVSPRGGLG